jgi:hypothetical protein
MRILNEDTDSKVDNIILYLTLKEAEELRNDLNNLITKPAGNHTHIEADDFKKQLTVCIYDVLKVHDYNFNERSIKLILNDE